MNTLIGRAIPRGTRNRGLSVLGAPLIEEILKTGSAAWRGAPVAVVHLTFGLVEAAYDMAGSSQPRFLNAAAGLVSHFIFGIVALQVMKLGGSWFVAVVISYPVHAVWNHTVLSLLGRPGR